MMYQEKPSALFVKYALPQTMGLLLNSIYLIVDGIFIGNRLGREAMAAAAVSVPVIEILIAISIAVSSGAGILISNNLGQKNTVSANQIFNQSVVVLSTVGGIIVIIGNILLGPLATLLGATPDIHAQASTYMWYIITFCPFLLLSFLLSGLVRSDNQPKLAMAALAVGSASNIVLDYVFMYPLNMGIAGAALATALGPIISVAILLPHFLRKRGYLFFSKFRISLAKGKEIFILGFPAFIMEFTIGIVTFIYNYAIIRHGYGEIGLASYLIMGYISLMVLTLFLGTAQGLQPIFSYHHGTGDLQRSKNLLRFSVIAVFSIGVISYVLVLLFSRGFISIFAPDDVELVDFTYGKCQVYFSGFLFAGYNILMISFWQSVHHAKSALSISLMRSIIVLPLLVAILPLLFPREAIWLCHSLGEVITALAAFGLSLSTSKPSVSTQRLSA